MCQRLRRASHVELKRVEQLLPGGVVSDEQQPAAVGRDGWGFVRFERHTGRGQRGRHMRPHVRCGASETPGPEHHEREPRQLPRSSMREAHGVGSGRRLSPQ